MAFHVILCIYEVLCISRINQSSDTGNKLKPFSTPSPVALVLRSFNGFLQLVTVVDSVAFLHLV